MSLPQQAPERVVTASTDDVPRDRRRDYWQDAVARVHLKQEVSAEPDADFSASLISVPLDDVNLIQVGCSAHVGRRRGRATDDHGQERCCFVATQRGRLLLRQEERECVLGPGEMALTDSRLAVEYAVTEPTTLLGVSLPRALLAQRIGGLERVGGRPLDQRQPIHRFASRYLEQLFALGPEIAAPELFRMKNHVIDLIAVTMGRLLGAEIQGSAYKAALLHRIKEFIEQRLHDPELGIGAVAERFRVTPRYVSELFRTEGATFNGFTRQRRLARCRQLLELSRANAPTIGEIAATVGFGSQAYLNKAFRKAFGTTPGDYRRAFQQRACDR